MEERKVKGESSKKGKAILLTAIILLLAIGGLIGGVIFVKGAPERQVRKYMLQVESYLSEKDYERAIAAYESVLRIDPKSAEAYLGLAKAYEKAGDLEEALEALEEGYVQTGDDRLARRIEKLEKQVGGEDKRDEIEKAEESEVRQILDEVDFRDALVERCVRDILHKKAGDAVTKAECASLSELTIDCRLGFGMVYNPLSLNFEQGNYVDLSDLQFMTGLKKLYIINHPENDFLANFDAVLNCQDLSELSFNYAPDRENPKWSFMWGYKYIGEIVQQLPKLKTLSLGDEVPEIYQKWIKGEQGSFDIQTQSSDSLDYVLSYAECKNACRVDDTEHVPDDIEDLIVHINDDMTNDLSFLAKYQNLKTLVILGEGRLSVEKISGSGKISNIEALKNNQELYALRICGVNGDFSGIGELTQLRELSIGYSEIDDVSFLSTLTNLRELSLQFNQTDGMEESFQRGKSGLGKCTLLCADFKDIVDVSWLQDLGCLETLVLRERYRPNIIKDKNKVKLDFLNGCIHVKYLDIEINSHKKTVDLSPLTSLPAVQFVTLYSMDYLRGIEKLLDMPNAISIAVVGEEESWDYEEKMNRRNIMLEKGAQKGGYSVLFVNPIAWHEYKMIQLYEGDKAVIDFFRHRGSENQDFYKAYQDCYVAHILCDGFDALEKIYPDPRQIEALILSQSSSP